MTEPERETLTVDDLPRIYIRSQDAAGHWDSIHCGEATDAQFDTWAKSRIEIQGEGAWALEERAKFCDMLYQANALVMISKDISLEEERIADAVKKLTAKGDETT